jgi:hypothetical protein
MVPISQIVGTLEPTKLFDRQFRPASDHVRARFQGIAAEILSGRGMDPVELYRCSGSYYVLDGRHRIAVARALGQRSVWALVTNVRLNNPAPACPSPRPPESSGRTGSGKGGRSPSRSDAVGVLGLSGHQRSSPGVLDAPIPNCEAPLEAVGPIPDRLSPTR